MRRFCTSLTVLQRRSIGLVGAALCICSSLSLCLHEIPPNHFLRATYVLIALIGASPIVLTLVVVGRYLAGESDEYLRSLVVRSILWGFGIVMVVDTVLGYLIAYESVQSIHLRSLGVFNLEIFVVCSGIALRVLLWRDR